jgi:hypothetical protein
VTFWPFWVFDHLAFQGRVLSIYFCFNINFCFNRGALSIVFCFTIKTIFNRGVLSIFFCFTINFCFNRGALSLVFCFTINLCVLPFVCVSFWGWTLSLKTNWYTKTVPKPKIYIEKKSLVLIKQKTDVQKQKMIQTVTETKMYIEKHKFIHKKWLQKQKNWYRKTKIDTQNDIQKQISIWSNGVPYRQLFQLMRLSVICFICVCVNGPLGEGGKRHLGPQMCDSHDTPLIISTCVHV